MYLRVIDVKPLEDYKLLLTFENQEVREYDMNDQMDLGIFKELKAPELFRQVRVGHETIEWPNGADFDPEILYEDSQAVQHN
ncbi:MAG: DUF2442 domain-containing protein [Candidatus Margulisiibacteriota bacterium]